MMKKILVLVCSLVAFVVFAQKTHTVEPKENPYSISKKYGITIEDLYKMNPKIKDGKLNMEMYWSSTKKQLRLQKLRQQKKQLFLVKLQLSFCNRNKLFMGLRSNITFPKPILEN